MSRFTIVTAMAGLAFLTSAPTFAQETAAETPAAPAVEYDEDTVLATVNGTEITLGHLITMRARLPQQYQQVPDEVLYDGILSQLVDQQLLAERQEADDGLSKGGKLFIENETRGILANEALTKFMERPVDEAEIEAAYAEQYGSLEPDQEFHASHILVETEEEANDLVTALEVGTDFAELAREKSTGPSGPQGGELGWFGRGAMVPEFEATVLTLEKGEVSAPVQTQFGWHVVKLNDIRDVPLPTLDETRDQLSAEINQKAFEAEIETMRAAADIDQPDLGIPVTAISQFELLED